MDKMIATCYIKKYDLILIDMWSLIDFRIEPPFITSCQECGLLNKAEQVKINNPDVVKLLYHNFIYQICEAIVTTKASHVAFCLANKIPETLELTQYIKKTHLTRIVKATTKKISKILPITFMEAIEYDTFCEFCAGVNANKGEALDLLTGTINKISKYKKKQYSLQSAKKFTAKYKLFFLNKDYFDQLKVKSLLSLR